MGRVRVSVKVEEVPFVLAGSCNADGGLGIKKIEETSRSNRA